MLSAHLLAAWFAASAAARRQGEQREPNHYRVLGVSRHASTSVIRRAFHEKALRLHPDKRRHQRHVDKASANADFARASQAFEVLRDPQRRAEYDAQLAAELLNPVEAAVDWILAQSPYVRHGLSQLGRRWASAAAILRSPGRISTLGREALDWIRRHWLEDRPYEMAFAGMEQLHTRAQLARRPALVAVYSSRQRVSEELLASARRLKRVCTGEMRHELACFVVDCWPIKAAEVCATLEPSRWARLVGRRHRLLLVLGKSVVDVGTASRLEAEVSRALMASRKDVVLDLRRNDALGAFVSRPGPDCKVLRLGDDYEPSRRFVALAHKYGHAAAFAEARASNVNLADALGIYRSFPTFVVLLGGRLSPSAVFSTPDALQHWLQTYVGTRTDYDDDVDDMWIRNSSRPQRSTTKLTRDRLEAMRASDLRQLLADRGLRCVGCLEKGDFISRILEGAK